jgi:hypothetical protein
MAPKYLTTCAELPANKPAGHPHLLDCSDATALQDFTFADAMATILYNWKPEALRAFLDLSKDKFVFKIEQAAGSTYIDFIIGRTGNTVMVSAAYTFFLTFSPTRHASGPFHSSPSLAPTTT